MSHAASPGDAPWLLIVPGLHDSPADHWQSHLQTQHAQARRVVQRDWATPDLDRWAARIGSTLQRCAGAGPCVAVAHSFGTLALLRHLMQTPDSPVRAALLVAPADPDKFGLGPSLPQRALQVPSTVVLSHNDPWLHFSKGQAWAARWGSAVIDLGAAGHINSTSGHQRLPLAERWVEAALQRLGEPLGKAA